MRTYVNTKDFRDFCINQDKLIEILNHRITKLEVHVNWLKKFAGAQTALLSGILLTLLGLIIKSFGG